MVSFAPLTDFASLTKQESYDSRDLETALKGISKERFNSAVMPCCKVNQNVGNCYTGSIFGGIISVICSQGNNMCGKRTMVFSYGSGSAASIYSFIARDTSSSSTFSLGRIKDTANIFERLEKRSKCSVEEFSAALALRAAKYGQAPMKPDGSVENIVPGTYYLEEVNDKHHRKYVLKK